MMSIPVYDVIGGGGGNAALSAALSAREHGASVAVLERAPEEERGGNSASTAGTMRAVYSGLDDIKALVPDLSDAEIAETDFSSYSEGQFFDDMAWVMRYRTHPYEADSRRLLQPDRTMRGVQADIGGRTTDVRGGAGVIACGGFQASAAWRTRYLGAGWDLAKVRGTRYDTGGGIRMALEAGAQSYGHWCGWHATEWDMHAPDYGDRSVCDRFQKHSYPVSIVVNNEGRRFVDEGADLRNYTHAEYGRVILEQPGQVTWQIFDSKTVRLLRDEYHLKGATKAKADALEARNAAALAKAA